MSGGGAAKGEARRAREEEAARERRISEGTETIRRKFGEAFNNSYYKKFEDAGHANYTPLIQRQYDKSLQDLRFALARNGLSQSTAANMQEADLDVQRKQAEDQATNQIRSQMNTRKADVAGQETVAVNQLQSSADPASAARQAAGLIKSQTELPGWSAMGQVFTDASAALANQAEAERSGNPRYNLGVSRWGDNARRYLSNIGGR